MSIDRAKPRRTPLLLAGEDGLERIVRHSVGAVTGARHNRPPGALPHLDVIPKGFDRHDVSGVQAHVGGTAPPGSPA